ncbi:MAG: A/G-specific adenine glycosylase [Geminicoccaceae bacterium]
MLPWRAGVGERADPYRVLVSEVMLQQTVVKTVEPRFHMFVNRFPAVEALAAASVDEVLHAWQGLGYYRRARGLHRAAGEIVRNHGGRIPDDVETLEGLPGIGAYTARAIAAIAFDRPVVPVDGNVRRVLARLAAIDRPATKLAAPIAALARKLESDFRASDTAQALMELGALCCRPANPACSTCPWERCCRSRALGLETSLPRPPERTRRSELFATAWLARRSDGAILFRRRPDEGLLGGLIELPSSPWCGTNAIVEPDFGTGFALLPGSVRHVFTHIRLEMRVMTGRCETHPDDFFHPPDERATLALPTLTRKLLRHAGLD